MEKTPRPTTLATSIPVISIVGHSGVGKTTLLEKLIRELKRRDHQVAVIKHHHRPGLQFDTPGKDTWRFAQAGADHVVLAGPDQVVHTRFFEQEPSLEDVLTSIQNVDLILTEGYKHAHAPKIEVSRGHGDAPLIAAHEEVIAIASDRRFDRNVPQFALEDIAGLASFIERQFLG